MKTPRLVLLAAAALLFGACATTGTNAPEAGDKTLTAADLTLGFAQKANRANGNFFEQVVCRATLDDGSRIFAQLRVSNLGPRADGDAQIYVSLIVAGKKRFLKVKRKKGKWTWKRDRLGADLQDASYEATPEGITIRITSGGMTLALDIKTILPPLRPAGGMATFLKGGYYSTTVLVPRGTLTGTISIPEPDGTSKSHALRGFAYAEHRQSDVALHQATPTWVSAYHITDKEGLMVSVFKEPKTRGGRVRGWLLHVDERGNMFYEPDVIVTVSGGVNEPRSGYSIPQVVKLSSKTGFKGVLKADKLVRVQDELASLSKLERFVVERITKPWSFYHDARYLLTRPGDGGALEKRGGKTSYVFMRLN